jgi:hypothetical protein
MGRWHGDKNDRFRGRLRNPKHERFAVEVASMVPVARAYVLAGYPDTEFARPNGSRLAHAASRRRANYLRSRHACRVQHGNDQAVD